MNPTPRHTRSLSLGVAGILAAGSLVGVSTATAQEPTPGSPLNATAGPAAQGSTPADEVAVGKRIKLAPQLPLSPANAVQVAANNVPPSPVGPFTTDNADLSSYDSLAPLSAITLYRPPDSGLGADLAQVALFAFGQYIGIALDTPLPDQSTRSEGPNHIAVDYLVGDPTNPAAPPDRLVTADFTLDADGVVRMDGETPPTPG